MFKSNIGMRGRVTALVFDGEGMLKREAPTGLRKLLGMPGRLVSMVNHNIITSEGEDLVADILQQTPERQKFDNTNAYIEVGTGYTAETQGQTSCNTPTGTLSNGHMNTGYPTTKGNWGAADGNVVVYQCTYQAGELNATGIDEAALMNNSTAASGDCFAYAQINPAVNVTTADTLQITWEITFTDDAA